MGAHVLRLHGEPVRLERRPFELLVLLVSRRGLLVPREDIIARLWPGNVVIDFDTGLNTLVRKVRHALADSPDHPAYIETVAGLGYRFIAPLTEPAMPPAASSSAAAGAAPLPWYARLGMSRTTATIAVASLIAALVALGSWYALQDEPSRKRIAVLPFENLTGNAELDYLAAGLAEETSASLAQVDLTNMRMIGRASAQAFAESTQSLSEIGRELGVDYMVVSSLRAEQSKIRVTTHLVRVSDDEQLWSASFDREMTSLLGLQRELSSAIAEQIRLRLSPDVAAAMIKRQTLNPEAYDLYLQGRYQWSLLTPAGSRRALELFEAAIAKDPAYALAWAGIAQVLSTGPITADVDPVFVRARARDAVERAVEYGADLSEVQYALGHYHLIMDWDWPAAESALRKSVAIDPNNALAHLFLGHTRSQSGDQVEAREMVRRARELDPLFSHTFALSAQVAYQGRDYPSAQELARQAVAINPEGWVGHLQLGQALAELGDFDGALAAFDDGLRFSDGNSKAVAYRAHLLARMGRKDEARTVIAELQAKAVERYVPPYAIALIYAGLSEYGDALDWLERALLVRDVHLFFLAVDPRWDPMREIPGFQSLVERGRFCGRSAVLRAGRCQATEASAAANPAEETTAGYVPGQTTMASANIDGIWTVKATAIAGIGTASGMAEFTGPPGKTRQMGMCFYRRYQSGTGPVPCETVEDCDSAPSVLPDGGRHHCMAPAGRGRKFCYYRPGQPAQYCAGSPALERARIPPGTYRVDRPAEAGSQWVTLACFNVCVAIPPAISESATVR